MSLTRCAASKKSISCNALNSNAKRTANLVPMRLAKCEEWGEEARDRGLASRYRAEASCCDCLCALIISVVKQEGNGPIDECAAIIVESKANFNLKFETSNLNYSCL